MNKSKSSSISNFSGLRSNDKDNLFASTFGASACSGRPLCLHETNKLKKQQLKFYMACASLVSVGPPKCHEALKTKIHSKILFDYFSVRSFYLLQSTLLITSPCGHSPCSKSHTPKGASPQHWYLQNYERILHFS